MEVKFIKKKEEENRDFCSCQLPTTKSQTNNMKKPTNFSQCQFKPQGGAFRLFLAVIEYLVIWSISEKKIFSVFALNTIGKEAGACFKLSVNKSTS